MTKSVCLFLILSNTHACVILTAQPNPQDTALGAQGLGLVSWRSIAVNHCHDAFGVVLEHQHGWKLVYSGVERERERSGWVCLCID